MRALSPAVACALLALSPGVGCGPPEAGANSAAVAGGQRPGQAAGQPGGPSEAASKAAGQPGTAASKPARVQTAIAAPGEGSRELRFLGQVRAALDADLAAAVEGHVLSVRAREGDRVKRGAVLLTLDGRKARASLAAARARRAGTAAELAQAERQYARVKDVTGPAISEPEREAFALSVARLSARAEAEQAAVGRLEVEASQFTLRAPFDGAVSRRRVDPGDWVTVGAPTLSLVSMGELEVLVDVPAEVGVGLAVGHPAVLIGRGGRAAAAVAGIVPALDPTTRTMRLRLRPDRQPQRPDWLLAGLALDVGLSLDFGGDGVLIPRDALLRGAVQTRVVRVTDGHADPVVVEVIAGVGERLLVRGQGLAAGQVVVVRGNERLRPGQALVTAPTAGGQTALPADTQHGRAGTAAKSAAKGR